MSLLKESASSSLMVPPSNTARLRPAPNPSQATWRKLARAPHTGLSFSVAIGANRKAPAQRQIPGPLSAR
jgi:hypothetical protein